MRISNRFSPLDDELSISYVMRLAFANGFPNETDFLTAFVSTDNSIQMTFVWTLRLWLTKSTLWILSNN